MKGTLPGRLPWRLRAKRFEKGKREQVVSVILRLVHERRNACIFQKGGDGVEVSSLCIFFDMAKQKLSC